MQRLVLAWLLAAACSNSGADGPDGSDGPDAPPPDVHAETTCGVWEGDYTGEVVCELACKDEPANHVGTGTDMPCTASNPGFGSVMSCERTFDYAGVRGCCIAISFGGFPPTRTEINFWQCN
ncbi:MAG TPA: hypothetical protein VIV11_37375 [Kofleriaceae bacterium]